jgi:hypothetical protein
MYNFCPFFGTEKAVIQGLLTFLYKKIKNIYS